MLQTLYAFLAMTIATFFSFNTQRAAMEGRMKIYAGELQMQATGIAARVLDYAQTLPFDANEEAESTGDLTSTQGFGPSSAQVELMGGFYQAGKSQFRVAEDVDDLHGMSEVVVVTSEEGSAEFDLSMSVGYVERTGDGYSARSSRTLFKEVVVTISGPVGEPVSISRVFAHQSS